MNRLWRQLGSDFTVEWESVRPRMLDVLAEGRLAAVSTASGYLDSVLAETGQYAPAVGEIVPSAFVRTAPDGRAVSSLLDQYPIRARSLIAAGVNVAGALAVAGNLLTATTLTMLADDRREVYGADITRRKNIAGYVRMLNPPSCKDCIILAGKWYRWNTGFKRHPRCDCQHIPVAEDAADDLRTDPYAYFNSLSEVEQSRLFGRIDARAIRDGGDIYRVVNTSNRGLATLKGHRVYGTPMRMTVDDIYRVAGTRTNAIRILEQEGYITGPQIRDGNVGGRMWEAFSGMTSVPRAGSARERVLAARSTGVRDPLDRATMTAAERRLFDASYRLQYARTYGSLPRSIGVNSADVASGAVGPVATTARLRELEDALRVEMSGIGVKQPSLQMLADELGLTEGGDAAAVFARIDKDMRDRYWRVMKRS